MLTAEPGLGRANVDQAQDPKTQQENLVPTNEAEITDLHEAQNQEEQSAYDKASQYFLDTGDSGRNVSEYFKQNIDKPMIQLVSYLPAVAPNQYRLEVD